LYKQINSKQSQQRNVADITYFNRFQRIFDRNSVIDISNMLNVVADADSVDLFNQDLTDFDMITRKTDLNRSDHRN